MAINMKHLETFLLKEIHLLSMICLALYQIESQKVFRAPKNLPPQHLYQSLLMVDGQCHSLLFKAAKFIQSLTITCMNTLSRI
jgi:hypothetical protein